MANLPSGTVTFLFTDIESSTSMWERDPLQMQAALARHDEILRNNIEANGGYVFKTVGDAFCAAFVTARQALEATLAAQRALLAEEWEEGATIRVRTALHTGATEERDGDYFGPPVNRVARLLSAGHGGQVLLSGVTYGLVRDNLGLLEPGAELRDLGEHRLKDLRYAERIYQFVVPDLPKEFPPLKTLDTRSNERYSLSRLVGSGKMSEVYLAHDQELDRDVAFKVLRSQYASDEQLVERFRREAKNAASLSHPNIVQVYDRGETEDGSYYMVMERVSGGTLKDRLLKESPLPAPTAIAIALQVAQALRVAHERGVIHRDIKPQNVLLTESGEVKVADFGIARASSSSSTMTKTGFLVGTAHYISPEQALGQPAGPKSDLYSLGVLLYEMLTGRVPYDAETPIGVAMKHVSGQLRPPEEVNPEVPEGISAVAVRLLARDPEDRYQSAAELIEDLKRVNQGQPPAFAAHRASSPTTTPAGSSVTPAPPTAPPSPEEVGARETGSSREDRYSRISLIGGGGMAEVYLARDRILDRNVALKVLRKQYADDEQFVERFEREAKNAASLSHPNIVAVHDRGETEDGAYYIVMERVSGGTLKDRLLKEGSLPASTATALALQIARALQVAHQHGVIHRDIKPQNVLLTGSGEVKVADFGIARAASSSTMTQEGAILGTTHYISPEQALGQPASPKSDLYSLGVVLYEMLTGEVPHDAETPIGVAMKRVSGQLRPPVEVNPEVPDGINAVTVRLLARDPKDRYQSAAELIEDLERVSQGQPPALVATQGASGPTATPADPSADPGGSGGDGHTPPPSAARRPDGTPSGPSPPARPGGEAGDGKSRRRRGLPWMLAAGLCGVVLLGVGIFLVGKFTSRGEQSSKPGYMLIKDDSGKLSVEVPSEWSDIDPTSWDFREGKIGLSLIASTDLDAWTWYSSSTGVEKASGMFFGVSSALLRAYPENTVDQILDLKEHNYSNICEYDNRYDYDDSVYEGKYDIWTNCGDTGTRLFVLAALPENQAPQHVLVIQIAARSEADLEAQKQILSTFKVSADNV